MILRLRCEDSKYHNFDKLKLPFKIYYNINVVDDNDDGDYYRYNVTMLLIINCLYDHYLHML